MAHLLNTEDLEFLLYDVLNAEDCCKMDYYKAHSREIFDATIRTAKHIAEHYFEPHNAKADEHEPQFDGERVTLIPEVKEAITHFVEAGFLTATQDFDLGGMQLPHVINAAAQAWFISANPSSLGYPFLTEAAANVINAFGSEEQKQGYLPAMLSFKASGTMALTEPDVGSSLGDLKTSAIPAGDHYLIKGQKMYISGGDHDLTENIVHLVLARIKGAPAGVKGISLFIVPKFLTDEQGNPVERNDVALAGLLHKMGYRGTTSTVLNFGEKNQCKGYLIGEAHQGLKYMFKMMNQARIGVGLGGAMIGYRGYLESLDYARNRVQGRAPDNRDPASPPVKLTDHADVRRMLLAQKSYVEGALHLCLFASKLVDESQHHPDEKHRAEAFSLLDLLTPVVKAWPSEYGPKANDLAIQVLGGAGYTRDFPVEQCYRDNRLNPIHEGTNGIQALDLLGRKLWQQSSQGLKLLSARILNSIKVAKGMESVAPLADRLSDEFKQLSELTMGLAMSLQKQETMLSTLGNASLYLSVFSRVVIGWLWLDQAATAQRQLDQGERKEEFLLGKIQAAKYFFQRELSQNTNEIRLLKEQDDSCLAMQDSWY
jgi:butyryl-CoA dehydrogenase